MELVIADTAGIQPYVFRSNRLRENVGASHLVARATGKWAFRAVREAAGRHNINPDDSLDQRHLKPDELDAEVLYTGGGNVAVLFASKEGAKKFVAGLSRKVLEEAPRLQLVIGTRPFSWDQPLSRVLDEIHRDLARLKRQRTPSAPLLGLSVTRACASTELPAVGFGRVRDDSYPASSEVLAKLAVAGRDQKAHQRLLETLPPPPGYDYPVDFDELGRTPGEWSYLGVVHADGDGVGRRLQQLGEQNLPNDKYVLALRDLSEAIDAAAVAALQEALELLCGYLERVFAKEGDALPSRAVGKISLPFRPIVFGGDDVTFVCDGRLALGLALAYLRAFEKHTANLPDGRGPATACAGVAIVKIHYPFARAYAMADELCRSAKDLRRQIRTTHANWAGSCIDWHFALGGLAGGIEEIRRREYEVGDGRLTLRPVTVGENPQIPYRAWGVVESGIEAFKDRDWAGRRNKLKALREALRLGQGAVGQFRSRFNNGARLPDVVHTQTNWPDCGWQGGYCGYFDALEAVDWFVPLEGGQP